MAAEAFNSLGGYTVGIPPTTVINENGAATFSSIVVSGFSSLGSVGNVFITGGENGYFLQTDGTGNLTWSPATGNSGNGNPGGANSQVQFNDAGNFGGDAGFTYDNVNNVLSVTGNIASYNFIASSNIYANGNITSNGDITSNANVNATYFTGNGAFLTGVVSGEANYAAYAGNVVIANQPNITAIGNLINLSVVGNITSGNANLGNAAIANYFIGNGSLLTGIAQANTAAKVANGSSNVNIPIMNGNIAMSVGGNPNVMIVTIDGVSSKNLNIIGTSAFSNLVITRKFSIANTTSNVSLGSVANLHIDGGENGFFLQTDGLGNLTWTSANAGGGNGLPGGANTQVQYNDAGLFGGSPAFTFNEVTRTAQITNLVANTFQMGTGIYEFYHSSVYFATTTTTDPDQVLWSTPLANLSAIDFTIVSTDATGNTRQTAKISAAILGTEVVFNEYSGLYINGGVGSFSVRYQAGSPDSVQLIVTPDSSNLTQYNMMIMQYAAT